MTEQITHTCNVCLGAIDGSSFDPQLGPVCNDCKKDLRWAHAWLTRKINGIKDCTVDHNYRIKHK